MCIDIIHVPGVLVTLAIKSAYFQSMDLKAVPHLYKMNKAPGVYFKLFTMVYLFRKHCHICITYRTF